MKISKKIIVRCLLFLIMSEVILSDEPFSHTYLNPVRTGGRQWVSKWNNGHARTLNWQKDPDDDWFDNQHGSPAKCEIDGLGTLTAEGDYVRMYINDPEKTTEWSENQEITVYYQRVSETRTLSYSGPQIFTRTNHGALLTGGRTSEEQALADTRGYGVKININGTFAFEKEVNHASGYASSYGPRAWDSFPLNQWIGIKYVIRNMSKNTAVKLQVYMDMTNGENGGKWNLVHEMVDVGDNFGVGLKACCPEADPAMILTNAKAFVNSESKKPHLAVYFRHEFGKMKYSRASIREIDPLP